MATPSPTVFESTSRSGFLSHDQCLHEPGAAVTTMSPSCSFLSVATSFATSPSESEVPLPAVSMDVRPGGSWREMLFQQRGSLPAEMYERAGQGCSAFFDRIAERPAAAAHP